MLLCWAACMLVLNFYKGCLQQSLWNGKAPLMCLFLYTKTSYRNAVRKAFLPRLCDPALFEQRPEVNIQSLADTQGRRLFGNFSVSMFAGYVHSSSALIHNTYSILDELTRKVRLVVDDDADTHRALAFQASGYTIPASSFAFINASLFVTRRVNKWMY